MNELAAQPTAGNQAARAPAAERRRVAIALGVAALAALASIGALASAERWPAARGLLAARGTGWLALAALSGSVLLAPLARATGARVPTLAFARTNVLRRALGMSAAWLALLHAVLAYQGWLLGDLRPIWTWPHLRAGLLGLLVLLLLLATSYGRGIALLRLRAWKELHRLSYVAGLLALQHVLLSPFAPRRLVLGLFAAGLLLWVLRLGAALRRSREGSAPQSPSLDT